MRAARTIFRANSTALFTACFVGLASCFPAWAQEAWPTIRPVKIVVPYSPGGSVDLVARKVAQKLSEQTGQTFIVENKPGASGTIGAAFVARAEPDGYTLMANDTSYALLPYIFQKLPFDYSRDLRGVSAFVFTPSALAVNASSPYTTLGALIENGRANPGKLTYGSGGAGTSPHFMSEALGLAVHARFQHIPFKGAAEATQALLSGTTDMQIASASILLSNVRAGKLRVLAVTGDRRLSALPGVPTFAEAGIGNFGFTNWTGLWTPKGTPPIILERLQAAIAAVMRTPDMQAFADGIGAEARVAGEPEFAKLLQESNLRWGHVAAVTGFDKQ